MADAMDRAWVDSMPDAYERLLVPTTFQPFAVDLTARALLSAPRRVLELAAGTGVFTRELLAVAPDVHVTATDFNAAMVDFGAAKAPGATWQQADAMELPFDDASFDLVVCQFGVMFFPDKVEAFTEARRVLVPGGRLLANVWDTIDTHDFEAAVVNGLAAIFPDDPPTFLVDIPHGFSDPAPLEAAMTAAGFDPVKVEKVTVTAHAASAADLATGYCTGTPMRASLEPRGDLEGTIRRLTAELETRLGTGPLTGRMSAHVFDAVKPR